MAVIPGLDERYIAGTDLSPFFIDKDTGAPLAGGKIYFYRDTQRLVPKLVYTLEGPNVGGEYYYVELGAEITLSGVGTIEDSIGNNVPLYYFPYISDTDSELDLYYIVVENALGVEQFTRQAWPTLSGSENPAGNGFGQQTNQITNPQFENIGVSQDSPTVTFTGATSGVMDVSQSWSLLYNTSGSGTLTVEQIPIAGVANLPTNPPFMLRVTPGTNITSLSLVQYLKGNPALWASGYVSAGILLGAGTSVTIRYLPSDGGQNITLLTQTNNTAAPVYYSNTTEIPTSVNPQTGDTGDIAITIQLSATSISQLSSVQVVSCAQGDTLPYVQDSIYRQRDYMAHLAQINSTFLPQNSLLTGWHFPLNPAQFFGRNVAALGAANQSYYAWDQTIVYQSAAAAFTISSDSADNGNFIITNASGGNAQFALVQYVAGARAAQMLYDALNFSASIRATASADTKLTVTLWASDSVPTMSSGGVGDSIVASLDANGRPLTLNGTWSEIVTPFSNPMSATFLAGEDTVRLFDYWSGNTASLSLAPVFAIVVGSSAIASTESVAFNFIGLYSSRSATYPQLQTAGEVLSECQYYWQKSYPNNQYAAAATFSGSKSAPMNFTSDAGNGFLMPTAFTLEFVVLMRATPSVTLYGTVDNTAPTNCVTAYMDYFSTTYQRTSYTNITVSTKWQATGGVGGSSPARVVYDAINTGSATPSSIPLLIAGLNPVAMGAGSISFHYIADARLGIV